MELADYLLDCILVKDDDVEEVEILETWTLEGFQFYILCLSFLTALVFIVVTTAFCDECLPGNDLRAGLNETLDYDYESVDSCTLCLRNVSETYNNPSNPSNPLKFRKSNARGPVRRLWSSLCGTKLKPLAKTSGISPCVRLNNVAVLDRYKKPPSILATHERINNYRENNLEQPAVSDKKAIHNGSRQRMIGVNRETNAEASPATSGCVVPRHSETVSRVGLTKNCVQCRFPKIKCMCSSTHCSCNSRSSSTCKTVIFNYASSDLARATSATPVKEREIDPRTSKKFILSPATFWGETGCDQGSYKQESTTETPNTINRVLQKSRIPIKCQPDRSSKVLTSSNTPQFPEDYSNPTVQCTVYVDPDPHAAEVKKVYLDSYLQTFGSSEASSPRRKTSARKIRRKVREGISASKGNRKTSTSAAFNDRPLGRKSKRGTFRTDSSTRLSCQNRTSLVGVERTVFNISEKRSDLSFESYHFKSGRITNESWQQNRHHICQDEIRHSTFTSLPGNSLMKGSLSSPYTTRAMSDSKDGSVDQALSCSEPAVVTPDLCGSRQDQVGLRKVQNQKMTLIRYRHSAVPDSLC